MDSAVRPLIHASSQNRVVVPMPMVTIIDAWNSALESSLTSMLSPCQGLLVSVLESHNHFAHNTVLIKQP
jgi:hypothetical protein